MNLGTDPDGASLQSSPSDISIVFCLSSVRLIRLGRFLWADSVSVDLVFGIYTLCPI